MTKLVRTVSLDTFARPTTFDIPTMGIVMSVVTCEYVSVITMINGQGLSTVVAYMLTGGYNMHTNNPLQFTQVTDDMCEVYE